MTIISLPRQTIFDTISTLDCEQFSGGHPHDYRNLEEILLDRLSEGGRNLQVPEQIYWFHGTRVLRPDSLRTGVYPLNQQSERIWQDLFGLAQCWVSEDQWQAFRLAVETTDPSQGSASYRRRMTHQADWGPHAVLVRDALVIPERFCGFDYLNVPEIIQDICLSFSRHFPYDLLSAFQGTSRPCVVKFRDSQPRTDAVGKAAAYIWCIARNELCVRCNACYEANGRLIAGTEILDVEVLL